MPKSASNKNLTHRLSIFLLKNTLATPANAVATVGTTQVTVDCGGVSAELYYRQAVPHPPGWAKFFEGDPVHAKLSSLYVASNAAVMLVPAGGRWFALVWGTGRALLEPGTFEDDFGLRVTLNSLTGDQVRSVDHVSFEEHTLQQRAQSSRAGTCTEFGVDVNQNLVKALTGIPSDKTPGVRMTGIDALAVSVEIGRTTLVPKLEGYLVQYTSTAYRSEFPWADHLRMVGDRAQVSSLDATLVDKLRTSDHTRMWMPPRSDVIGRARRGVWAVAARRAVTGQDAPCATAAGSTAVALTAAVIIPRFLRAEGLHKTLCRLGTGPLDEVVRLRPVRRLDYA